MRVRYDREEDILMIEMASEGVIDHAEHTKPLISHFHRDGQLLLLEILDASELVRKTLGDHVLSNLIESKKIEWER